MWMLHRRHVLALAASACRTAARAETAALTELAFAAAELRFNKSILATRVGGRGVYCLLGTGFFRTIRSDDVDALIADWLAAHPRSQATPVTAIDEGSNVGPIVYIWIESGGESLNLHLVRQGAFPGGVMADAVAYRSAVPAAPQPGRTGQPPRRFVTNERYDGFMRRVLDAEAEAMSGKRGIWSDRYAQLRKDEGVP